MPVVNFRGHRTPYRIEAEYTLLNLTCVAMTNDYYRVLHVPSGVCLCDTYSMKDATIVINKLHHDSRHDKDLKRALRKLSWGNVCQFGRKDSDMAIITDRVNRISGTIPMASKHDTEDCTYKNIPEFKS